MRGPQSFASELESRVRALILRVRRVFHHALFDVDESALPAPLRTTLLVLRLGFVTVDSFFRERLQMRAAALAFFTMLGVVPFAALAFAIAKEFGAFDLLVTDTVRPFIDETFRATPGEEVPEGVAVFRTTLEQILEMVSATSVRGLGLLGLGVLVVTTHRVVRGAEEAFDAIWGFPGERSFVRRLPGYVLVTLVTPAALLSASTVTAATHGQPVVELMNRVVQMPWLVSLLTYALPPVLVCMGILLLYVTLPSARVRRRSALIGAIIGGVAWTLIQILHVRFQLGVARANAIYSGFGAFPIFLLWLHLSWVCILLGAQVAAAHQNAPTLRQLARRSLADHASRQAIALRAMVRLAGGASAERLREMARELGVAVEPLRDVLDALVEHRLLERNEGPYDPLYAPQSDPEALRVAEVLEAVNRERGDRGELPWKDEEAGVVSVLDGLSSAAAASDHNRTIGELARVSQPASAPDVLHPGHVPGAVDEPDG